MEYTYKWFEKYEKVHNLTKESLKEGLKFFNKYNNVDYYIFVRGNELFYYDTTLLKFKTENPDLYKDAHEYAGVKTEYVDNKSVLSNIYPLLNKYHGTYGRAETNLLKKFLEYDITRGITPDDDGLYVTYRHIDV